MSQTLPELFRKPGMLQSLRPPTHEDRELNGTEDPGYFEVCAIHAPSSVVPTHK
jgi:hypothetical protein